MYIMAATYNTVSHDQPKKKPKNASKYGLNIDSLSLDIGHVPPFYVLSRKLICHQHIHIDIYHFPLGWITELKHKSDYLQSQYLTSLIFSESLKRFAKMWNKQLCIFSPASVSYKCDMSRHLSSNLCQSLCRLKLLWSPRIIQIFLGKCLKTNGC